MNAPTLHQVKCEVICRAGPIVVRRHTGSASGSFLSVVDSRREIRDSGDWYGRFPDTASGLESAKVVCSGVCCLEDSLSFAEFRSERADYDARRLSYSAPFPRTAFDALYLTAAGHKALDAVVTPQADKAVSA